MTILYLDWSGDAGFKFREASSQFLTFACVTNPKGFSGALDQLRRDYVLEKNFHFHFADASRLIKNPFFGNLAETDISGVVLRVNKPRLSHNFRKKRGDDLIAFFIAETVSQFSPHLVDKSILAIDGNRDESALTQKIRVAVSTRLRSIGTAYFKQIRIRPAREEDGLQVADMLAGAAGSNNMNDNALLGYLRDRIKLVDFKG